MGDKPSEIGFIIVGIIFIWMGYILLSVPLLSSLALGFILAGIVSIIGGALSLLHR